MRDSIIKDVNNLVNTVRSRDPFEICDMIDNFNLHFHNLQEKIKGYYLFHNDVHNIIVDTNLSRQEQRIIIGHEIGHARLHTGISQAFHETDISNNTDRIEFEANQFCAELLIPDDDFFSAISFENMIDNIAAELNVPTWLLDCKIRLLNEKGYNFPYLYKVNTQSITY